jgi:hypothetical protein
MAPVEFVSTGAIARLFLDFLFRVELSEITAPETRPRLLAARAANKEEGQHLARSRVRASVEVVYVHVAGSIAGLHAAYGSAWPGGDLVSVTSVESASVGNIVSLVTADSIATCETP